MNIRKFADGSTPSCPRFDHITPDLRAPDLDDPAGNTDVGGTTLENGSELVSDKLLDIPVKRADGHETTLSDYRGEVILVVNVASKCGLTVQYEGLEKLYEDKRDRGFVIAAFPANDFKGQEPGTDDEIVAFCTSTYDVKFPIFSKISVKGEETHPLYRQLTAAAPEAIGEGPMRDRLNGHGIETGDKGEVLWNFEKFLIGRDGKVAARFAPDVTADDQRFMAVVDRELAKAN
jgi:glutathione peroxidase